MESERPHLSITLPRSFQFHYQDSPRTPEPMMSPEDSQPPPPPRPILKVRRRRTTTVSIHPEFLDATGACPIPTIEAPELYSETSMDLPAMPDALNHDYLSPALSFTRMLSPPKTPVSQMRSLDDCQDIQDWSAMGQANRNVSWSRPTSSSGFSDSSLSSRGSFDSFLSVGGSCTSPEDEMTDPFPYYSEEKYRLQNNSSPLASQGSSVPKMKIRLRLSFNEAMDYHLWKTYEEYVQDARVTPFKALPGTVPPNGVCHRVARIARKTWKGPRASSTLSVYRPAPRYASRCGTPDTIKPAKSGSSTPVPGMNKPYMRFPSEKQCRKRLRELAKQKPSLSAHYQRLLRRSPSPFQSSPPPEAAPEPSQSQKLSSPFVQENSAFSTRDMNVSLATSTAASMQLGNPLSRLTTESTTPRPNHDWSSARVSAHQKSQSLHIGLGLSSMLGSSFARMNEMTDSSMNQHNAKTWHAPTAVPPRLGSPLQLHSPRPISRPFRRRALHNFEEQARSRGNSFVNEVFGAPAESSHRRVRSRGFSLGDMMDGARRLPLSATGPPPAFNPFANIAEVMPGAQRPSAESRLSEGQGITRLGSPFIAKTNNTFPRASTSYGFEPPASFEQRFAEYRASPNRSSRS